MSDLIILGASTRAAAFSALRAGLRPRCADLFADRDLAARCVVERVSAEEYPRALGKILKQAPDVPWLYLGGLENHPRLIAKWAQRKTLWGNDAAALRRARDPFLLASLFDAARVSHPEIRSVGEAPSHPERWLVKPRRGSGGLGIHFFRKSGYSSRQASQLYCQERIKGTSCSALFVGNYPEARLLGVTQQLIGEPWLHAMPFQYCGSIGPISLDRKVEAKLLAIGSVLVKQIKLRGLFGVDYVLRDNVPWPVEVNPRYVASAEVLEHSIGACALAEHRRAFVPDAEIIGHPSKAPIVIGKAILYARAELTFPRKGPWLDALDDADVHRAPRSADVPHPDERIEKGHPILTLFAESDSILECRAELQRRAVDLDAFLFRP